MKTSVAQYASGMGIGLIVRPHLCFRKTSFRFAHRSLQKYNIADKLNLTAETILDLPLLVQDAGKYGWLGWRDWFAQHGVAYEFYPNRETINNYAFILQAAMEGKGIALVWEGLDAPYLERRWLVELGNLRVTTGNAYYLTFPKNSPFADRVSQAFT